MSVNLNDAVVALAGFPRRYNEVLAGPRNDDAWDRLVRAVPKGASHSALGTTAHMAVLLHALADLASALPTTKRPELLRSDPGEPSADTSIDDVVGRLRTAALSASAAVKARSHDDLARPVVVDGHETTFGAALDRVVQEVAAGVRNIESVLLSR